MRSYAHKSLTKLIPRHEEWVKNVLIPELTKETGISWELDHDLVKSGKLFFDLPYDDRISISQGLNNRILEKILKLYPTLTEECIGYCIIDEKDYSGNKVRSWPRKEKHWTTCWGYWAINTENIVKRGHLIAKEYGI